MAKALYNKPTGNPFEALQHAEDEAETKATAGKKPDGAVVPSPAERAAARAAVQAQKEAEREAARKKEETDRMLEAQAGPLEGFQVQKGSQPRKPADRDAKKMTREDYEKNGGQLPQPPEGKKAPRDGENKERKPFRDGEKGERKPYQGNRDGEKGERKQPYNAPGTPETEKRVDRRQFPGNKEGPRGQGEGGERKPRGREFDKHSAGKTGNKFEPKRQGGGQANWGSPIETADANATAGWGTDPDAGASDKTPVGGWGDEGAQATEPVAAATGGWGDEGEPKAAVPVEPEKEVFVAEEKKREDRAPAWDEEEGYGKLTFAEYEKVKAQKDAELLAKIGGSKELLKVETPQALAKFHDWRDDLADDKDKKLAAKKEQKKGQQKSGVKEVQLNEVFDVKGPGGRGGRGGRGGGRGGRGGFQDERPPRAEGQQAGEDKPRRGGYQGNRGQGGAQHRVPGAKQFPDLVPQNAPKQTK